MVQDATANQPQEVTQLLRSVAEQLKTPLTTIVRQAELSQLTGTSNVEDFSIIRTHATAALTLVDSYLLGLELMRDQATLALEPVSISSLLVETAHELEGLAKQYGTKLELRIAGKYGPVMAHQSGLKYALIALGYALLEGYPLGDQGTLILAAHRSPHGIITGLYGKYENFSSDSWRRALRLKDHARQPFSSLSGNGAGLFVADAIFQAMASQLRVGHHLKQQGLAATLQPSQQLSFV